MKGFLLMICVLGLFSMGLAQAPVPGYLGKRVHVGLGVMTNIDLATNNNTLHYRTGSPGATDNVGVLTHVFAGKVGYALGKRVDLTMDFRYARMGYGYSNNGPVFERMRALAAVLECNIFPFLRKGGMAPIGPYTRFSLGGAYATAFSTLPAVGDNPPETGNQLDSKLFRVAHIGVGNNVVLSDLIYWGLGGQLGFLNQFNFAQTDNFRYNEMRERLSQGWTLSIYTEFHFMF